MRAALLILLGLAIGIIATVNVMNSLSERHPMPLAVMHTLDYHFDLLHDRIRSKQCTAADNRLHLERIQSTAGDIVPVFGIDEKPFQDDAANLQTATGQALAAAPADCPALTAALKPIGAACKSCHQKYR